MEYTLVKVFIPAVIAFMIGILLTPLITHYLYKWKVWKKTGGKTAMGGHVATEFNRLKGEAEVKTPRMGGIVIWGSVLGTVGVLWLATMLAPLSTLADIFFVSRAQTWIPLATLFVGAAVGFLNDYYDVVHGGKGLRLKVRLFLITILAGSIALWFYDKLDLTGINIPGYGFWELGWLIIPVFIIFTLFLYASGVIDGIDGLSGGVFASVFLSYAGIAVIQQQYDLAAFCATVAGGIMAFLWFNIAPARFWMTETGSMALTLTLAVVALMTDAFGGGFGLLLFFVIGFPLVATVFSNVLQLVYRRATGKKLFRIAPLHHHFEAIGWPSTKVVMRYWILSIVCAIAGLALAASL